MPGAKIRPNRRIVISSYLGLLQPHIPKPANRISRIRPNRGLAEYLLGDFDVMNINIVIDCIFIGGFLFYAFVPFDKKRIRARWAKAVFLVSAVIGIAKGVVGLAWDMGWFALGTEASRRLDAWLYMAGGLLLGFIFSLIFSGQLVGMKKSPNNSLQATAAAPASCD